jgi:hypothetical protein
MYAIVTLATNRFVAKSARRTVSAAKTGQAAYAVDAPLERYELHR